jgi:hypothetical protein
MANLQAERFKPEPKSSAQNIAALSGRTRMGIRAWGYAVFTTTYGA